MSPPEAKHLRDLARAVENLATDSPAYSTVWEIVRVFVDHLSAKARVIEQRGEEEGAP
jgi:hypothetical protein